MQSGARMAWDTQEPTAAYFAEQFRAMLANARWSEAAPAIRGDHLALLQRWHESSFRKGEFVPFAEVDTPPIRKLANAALRLSGDLGGESSAGERVTSAN